ncbi:MAG: hypothetical protein M3P18_01970, partial [Actinomycetota bacterium]|nr:hypothetical protein [Actinomycetota bacterium]
MSAASLKADKRRPFRWQAAVAAVAGPLLIAAVLVVVLRGMVFGGVLPSQNKDILSFFLPNECFLGRALRAGQVPGWNPFAMGGVPFAADPQSGWMYLPTMVLYGLFRCDTAMRLLLVVHPLLAGLGVYWFLRAERASRPAATTAGLVLSLAIAGSKIATNVPFGGVLAWSALLLAAAACYLRARTWSARLGWAALAGVFWSQLAASHLSNGLITGTGALVVYVIVAVSRGLKTKDLTWRRVVALSALLTTALPTVSLAYLLPRLHYIPETDLTLGYDGMRQVAARFAGIHVRALKIVLAANATWPLRLGTSPGAYAGAIPLLLSFGGLFNKRHRRLTAALLVYAAVLYVVAMKAVVARIAPLVHSLPFADFYPHRPERFRYGILLAIAVLAGLGVEAWRRADAHRRAVMILPGVVVWVALPLAVGAPPGRLALLAAGAVAGGAALLAATRRPQLLAVVPVVLAFELGASALWGQSWG